MEEEKDIPSEAPKEETPASASSPEDVSLAETPQDVISGNTLDNYDTIEPGMTVRVYQQIKDVTSKGTERERVQYFEGIVLARKHGRERGATIMVRKISHGVGVEKIFPLQLPTITKIEVVKKLARRRRSKLYFLRSGYKKRLREEYL